MRETYCILWLEGVVAHIVEPMPPSVRALRGTLLLVAAAAIAVAPAHARAQKPSAAAAAGARRAPAALPMISDTALAQIVDDLDSLIAEAARIAAGPSPTAVMTREALRGQPGSSS